MGSQSLSVKSAWKNKLRKIKSVGLDTMCFIYQFDGNPVFGPLVFHLFSLLEERKLKGFTSVLSLAEILSAPKLHDNKQFWFETREKFWQTPNLEATTVDSKIAEASSMIRNKYLLRLPDAIQITTAIFNKVDIFITNDDKMKKVKETQVILLKDYI